MGVFASRSTSRTSTGCRTTPCNSAKAVAVGELLNGKYLVKAVEEDENGWPQYKCTTLNGHEEVLVRCMGRKNKTEAASLARLLRGKPRAIVLSSDDESSYLDSFQVPSESDMLITDDQAKRLNWDSANFSPDTQRNEYRASDNNIENSRPVQEPEQRPAPCLSNIQIYKRGEGYLEVDIPSRGNGWDRVFFPLMYAAFLGQGCFWALCLLVMLISIVNWGVQSGKVGDTLMGLTFCLLVAFNMMPGLTDSILMTRAAKKRGISFTHENLTITPKNFRIKRTVELWQRHRDPVNTAARAEARLTLLDRIFCKQVAGATSDLTIANTEPDSTYDGREWVHIALMKGDRRHRLNILLSKDEGEWMISEINKTLQEIKKSHVSAGETRLTSLGTKQKL